MLEYHNDRKFTTAGISFYEETSILEKEIKDSELAAFLDILDKSPDPENLFARLQVDVTCPDGNPLDLFDHFAKTHANIHSTEPASPQSNETEHQSSQPHTNRLENGQEQHVEAVSSESKAEGSHHERANSETEQQNGAENSNTSEKAPEQGKREESDAEGKEKREEMEKIRQHIEYLKNENAKLKELAKNLQNQVGMVLNEKKKATTIAKRFQQISNSDQVQLKDSIAKLQNVKDTLNKAPDDPELVALRDAKQKFRQASTFLVSNLVDPTQLAQRIFKGLSADNVRFNGMEGWINIRSYSKSIFFPFFSIFANFNGIFIAEKDSNEKQKNNMKFNRRWVILNSGFLFAFEDFDSEAPTDLILLDRCKVIQETSENEVESEIKMREIIARQSTVEKSVARWLGENEKEDKKKKKLRLSASRKTVVENRSKFRGVFCFVLEENDLVHQLGCDSGNMLKMWIDACTNYTPWYEDMDFTSP